MTRSQLHRAVARATGDDYQVMMQRGFSLVDDASPLMDDDLEALIADWDSIEAEEMTSRSRSIDSSPARVPTSRRAVRAIRTTRRQAKLRHKTDTVH